MIVLSEDFQNIVPTASTVNTGTRQRRLFMTFITASCMALVMLFFMRHMRKNMKANLSIVVADQ